MRYYLSIISLILSLVLSLPGNSQTIDLTKYKSTLSREHIKIYQISSDTLFAGKQNVFVAEIKNRAHSGYNFAIAYSDSLLKKTSQFGEENNAIVALNGGFFDVNKGGSVAYLESKGIVIAENRNAKEKWAKTDSLLNGAIILENSGRLKVEIAKPVSYYKKSRDEKSVLVSGPILLADGKILPLENSPFVNNRHPRSCLCVTSKNNILFIAIDGRSQIAYGMNLKELQQVLLHLNCRDAINLDGGGSTTLWINNGVEKQIINKPSDKEGERPVSNILLIKKR